MSLVDEFRSLRRMAERLPFALDDAGQANDAFLRRRSGDESVRVTVDLYAYLYARRYFLVKFIGNRNLPPTECDALVSRAFETYQTKADRVERADRFASWLSVVCANTFRNYLSRRGPVHNLDGEAMERVPGDEIDTAALDRGAVKTVLLAAILRLPNFLQDIARMRLVENLSYAQMAEATGRNEGTMRSYVGKALARLREDDELRELRGR